MRHEECRKEANRLGDVCAVADNVIWRLDDLAPQLQRIDGHTIRPLIEFVAFPAGWRYRPGGGK